MQTKLHEEIDADLNEEFPVSSDIKTERHQSEIYCGACGKLYYTDIDTHDKFTRAIEQGLDNPFVCDECSDEYEALAHEAR